MLWSLSLGLIELLFNGLKRFELIFRFFKLNLKSADLRILSYWCPQSLIKIRLCLLTLLGQFRIFFLQLCQFLVLFLLGCQVVLNGCFLAFVFLQALEVLNFDCLVLDAQVLGSSFCPFVFSESGHQDLVVKFQFFSLIKCVEWITLR